MKLTEYRVEYKHEGKWHNADMDNFLNLDDAIARLKIYRVCDKDRGVKLEYRIVTRVVDYGGWEEVWK